jgi:hypothetical protein
MNGKHESLPDPDEVLRRMLATPPDPKRAKPKRKAKAKKKPAK